MKKIISLVLGVVILLATVLTFASCSSEPANQLTERNIVDMSGSSITIPEQIDKYCVLYSTAVSMCGMLDQGLHHMCMCPTLYANWTYRLFPDLKDRVIVVDKKSVTAEQILESESQVVFYASSTNADLIETLKLSGVACINVSVGNADDVISAMGIIAETLGTDYAKNILESYKTKFNEYKSYAEAHVSQIPKENRKNVLVLGDIVDLTGFGANSYEAFWSKLVGLDYIVPSDDNAAKVTLTMEQIYDFDPDVVVAEQFIGYSEESTVYGNPKWDGLRAVSEENVFANPSVIDTWSKPGAETPLQYIWALDKFYPDYKGDVDIKKEVQSFYKDFYNYEMSDEHVTEVLAGHIIPLE